MANISIDNITNGTTVLDGTGSFDKLMQALTVHLEDQFDKGRLVGTDYATVYLGGIQSVFTTALQLEVQQQQLILSKIPSVK